MARDIATLNVMVPAAKPPTIPRQLPPRPSWFVNRADEISQLDRFASAARPRGSGAVLVLHGRAGVGKSAVARVWAHANIDKFFDGQLHADFESTTVGAGPAVGDVLRSFLRGIGVPDSDISPNREDNLARFRSETAGHHMLVLLDNVDTAAQVRPLVPASSNALVVVTSQRPFEDFYPDSTDCVFVGNLDTDSALELLRVGVGAERVDRELQAARQLVTLCDGLPVAIQICSAMLVSPPHRSLGWLADRLQNDPKALDDFRMADHRSLRAIFDEAYGRLAPEEALVYRCMGVHPGRTVEPVVVAAATGLTITGAETALDRLARLRLAEFEQGRYRLHDRLRNHAKGVAASEHFTGAVDGESAERESHRLRDRIIRFYASAAQRMDRAITPNRLRTSPVADPGIPSVSFSSARQAYDWFEAERRNLAAVQQAAIEWGLHPEGCAIGEAVWLACDLHKHHQDAVEFSRLAAIAAHEVGEGDAEARLRGQLGLALRRVGQLDEAEVELATARELTQSSSNRALRYSIVEWTGVLLAARGQLDPAREAFDLARVGFHEIGDRRGEALQSYLIGGLLLANDEAAAAVASLSAAVALVDPQRDGLTAARMQLRLGQAHLKLGQMARARDALMFALALFERDGAPDYKARTYEVLADIEERDHALDAARSNLLLARAVYSELGSIKVHDINERLANLA